MCEWTDLDSAQFRIQVSNSSLYEVVTKHDPDPAQVRKIMRDVIRSLDLSAEGLEHSRPCQADILQVATEVRALADALVYLHKAKQGEVAFWAGLTGLINWGFAIETRLGATLGAHLGPDTHDAIH